MAMVVPLLLCCVFVPCDDGVYIAERAHCHRNEGQAGVVRGRAEGRFEPVLSP